MGKAKQPTTMDWYKAPPGFLQPGSRDHSPEVLRAPEDAAPMLLFTGAGYSVSWGLPTTQGLLDRILELNFTDPELQKLIMEPVHQLLRYIIEREGEAFDLEEFLTWIVDTGMADDIRWWERTGFPDRDRPTEDAEFFYRALTMLFGRVLLHEDPLSDRQRLIDRNIPQQYLDLEAEHGRLKGVVSLNYDTVPEALYANRGIDYGIRSKDLLVARSVQQGEIDTSENLEKQLEMLEEEAANLPTDQIIEAMAVQPYHTLQATERFVPGNFPVYKLHGSMNMTYCPHCDSTIVLPPFVELLPEERWDYPAYRFGWPRTAGHHAAFHCTKPGGKVPPNMEEHRLRPLAIPPVKSKEALPGWDVLRPVKEAACKLAGEVEKMLIVGSSMREADRAAWDVVDSFGGDSIVYIGGEDGADALRRAGHKVEHAGTRF